MTIMEERFMKCVPSFLHGIEESVRAIPELCASPIIRFTEKNGVVHIEQFKSLEDETDRFLVNGNLVDETEYRRIEKIISSHPLFKN